MHQLYSIQAQSTLVSSLYSEFKYLSLALGVKLFNVPNFLSLARRALDTERTGWVVAMQFPY